MSGRTSFSTLRSRMSPASHARARDKSDALETDMALADVRRAMKLLHEELATLLQINQASVAKMEKRTDMYIGTLRRFIQAMGGELDIVARFPDRQIKIDQFRTAFSNPQHRNT